MNEKTKAKYNIFRKIMKIKGFAQKLLLTKMVFVDLPVLMRFYKIANAVKDF